MEKGHFVISVVGAGNLQDLGLVTDIDTALRIANEFFNTYSKEYSEDGYLKITHFAYMGVRGDDAFTVHLDWDLEEINKDITKIFGEENIWS